MAHPPLTSRQPRPSPGTLFAEERELVICWPSRAENQKVLAEWILDWSLTELGFPLRLWGGAATMLGLQAQRFPFTWPEKSQLAQFSFYRSSQETADVLATLGAEIDNQFLFVRRNYRRDERLWSVRLLRFQVFAIGSELLI